MNLTLFFVDKSSDKVKYVFGAIQIILETLGEGWGVDMGHCHKGERRDHPKSHVTLKNWMHIGVLTFKKQLLNIVLENLI